MTAERWFAKYPPLVPALLSVGLAIGLPWLVNPLLGALLVEIGGYKLFEKLMRVCIGVMFVTVLVTAARVGPDLSAVATGLLRPRIPDVEGGVSWTIALLGGIRGLLQLF